MSDVISLKVENEVFDLDMDGLTWGELAELEEVAFGGESIDAINLESARGMIGLAWLARKRKYPQTIIDDLKRLPVGSIEVVESDPTTAGDPGEDVDSGPQS
jgi:hypothetical protein